MNPMVIVETLSGLIGAIIQVARRDPKRLAEVLPDSLRIEIEMARARAEAIAKFAGEDRDEAP